MKIEDEIAQVKFKNEHQKALINLTYTYNWVHRHQRDFFKQYKVTPQQYNVLRILRGQYPNPGNINLIKERIMDKTSDASRLVDRLVTKKYVVRYQNKTDRRSTNLFISDQGLALLQEIDLKIGVLEDLFANLNQKEAKQLNALLDKLRDRTT